MTQKARPAAACPLAKKCGGCQRISRSAFLLYGPVVIRLRSLREEGCCR